MLSEWGQDVTGSFSKRLSKCKKILTVTKGRRDEASMSQYKEESKNLTEILTQQEVFWKQRSKQLWLKEGDQNSKFFHQSARVRRKSNQIRTLLNDEGVEIGWDDGLQELMAGYFNNLFQASNTN